jgi:hypothetical protein
MFEFEVGRHKLLGGLEVFLAVLAVSLTQLMDCRVVRKNRACFESTHQE